MAQVAAGKRAANLLVRGGKLVNVLTREIYPADIAVLDHRIAAVGQVDYTRGPETVVVDATGKYVTPGFIDQHIHIHETQLNVVEFAGAVLPHGTTGVCTDLYGELVVGGVPAVRGCLDAARGLPLKMWFMLGTPGFYQNRPFGHTGWPTFDEMLMMLDWPECAGLDDTSASRVASGDADMLRLVDAVQQRGKRVCGHGSEVRGRALSAWTAYVKASNDHECLTADEAADKARLGLHIAMREGSGCSNVADVVRAVTEYGLDPRRFCFSTDLISPVEIAESGHIDRAMRRAIRRGVPPVVAIQMATLNAAECLRVDDDYGSVSPGKVADLVLLDDLAEVRVTGVIADGAVVAEYGQLSTPLPPARYPEVALHTVRLARPIVPADFAIRVNAGRDRERVRVISAAGDNLVTGEIHETMSVHGGEIKADPERDLLKVAAIERVRGTGELGVGLIRGFALHRGAIATTYSSQQQNLIVLGADDRDMAVAANALAQAGGGFVAVEGGVVRGMLELPLFGLQSDQPFAAVVTRLKELNRIVAEMGCPFPAAFHTLGFVGLPVEIGALKISPQGLVDVWGGKVVELVI